MAARHIDGYRASLAAPLRATDLEISLRRAEAIALNVIGVGNHTYLTISDRMKSEVVRYDHLADWDGTDAAVVALVVTRDVSGLGPRSFAVGACVEALLTSFLIRDIIAEALPSCDTVLTPPTTEQAELPTTLYGGRDALLGDPAGFVEWCPGKKVPFYSEP